MIAKKVKIDIFTDLIKSVEPFSNNSLYLNKKHAKVTEKNVAPPKKKNGYHNNKNN
ncbi:hypothetical protein JCM19296_2864 [Nonlabens ulvanivorans]|uniref:Uncharacterized protein n=1 Tax=Nonlabens ulvanivorans TaxID=906888 RepID=A0A081DEB3_NONUL|nr:hypothetical protein JCM19296_2864 [Nonlabens ulvanivorans]